MKTTVKKNQAKLRRHRRVRAKVFGTSKRPRLSVFRSLKHISVQLIDDEKGNTLVSANDSEIKTGKTKTEKAEALGRLIAERSLAKNITVTVFDKGAGRFHGRIKAVADGARANGLKI